MKLSVAAAAIAFSGTALIFAPTAASAAPVEGKAQSIAKAGLHGADFGKAGFANVGFAKAGATGKAGASTAKLETADHQDMGGPLEEKSMMGKNGAMGSKLDAGSGKAGLGDAGSKVHAASMDMGGKAFSDDGGMGKFASADMSGGEGKLASTAMEGGEGKPTSTEMDSGQGKLASADMDGGEGKLAMNGKTGAGAPDHLGSKQASQHDSSQAVETAVVAKEAMAPGAAIGQSKEAYAGMGGPEEAVTEYPPCQPGPGDDRCIQLYEVGRSAKA